MRHGQQNFVKYIFAVGNSFVTNVNRGYISTLIHIHGWVIVSWNFISQDNNYSGTTSWCINRPTSHSWIIHYLFVCQSEVGCLEIVIELGGIACSDDHGCYRWLVEKPRYCHLSYCCLCKWRCVHKTNEATHTHIHVHVHMHTHMHTHAHAHTHAHTHTCTRARTHTHIHACCTCTRMHTHKRTHTHHVQ